VLGGCRYGGKPRRRATAQGHGSGITEGPEAVDVRDTAAGGSETGGPTAEGEARPACRVEAALRGAVPAARPAPGVAAALLAAPASRPAPGAAAAAGSVPGATAAASV
jgi:hypothetical protein